MFHSWTISLYLLSLVLSLQICLAKSFVSVCNEKSNFKINEKYRFGHDKLILNKVSSNEVISSTNNFAQWPFEADINELRGGNVGDEGISTKHSSVLLLSTFYDVISKTKTRCWVTLLFAIFVEIAASAIMKIASDSSSTFKLVQALFLYMCSLLCFFVSLRQLDLSVSYAVWSGLGTAVVSFLGMALFGEAINLRKFFGLSLVIIGVVALNLDSPH